ncbi:MAG: hypothetical protein KAR40_01710 [Candidatus Sabulitectum sp.]|nr:hypothetical protein [Candidatus Sabulitectum sp.]
MKLLTQVLFLLIVSARGVCASDGGITHRLGVSGGFPQLVAITYQVTTSRHLSFEACAGCIPFYYTTAAFRIIAGDSSNGFHPRYFAGTAIVDDVYSADPNAVTSYLWAGAGLGYAFDRFRLFADLGYIGGGDRDKGLGYSTGLALNGGFLFDL